MRKAEVVEAVSVKLVPVDEGFVNCVRRRLLNYPLTIGDIVPVPVLGEPITFKAVSTGPHSIIVAASKTNVVVYPWALYFTLQGDTMESWFYEYAYLCFKD